LSETHQFIISFNIDSNGKVRGGVHDGFTTKAANTISAIALGVAHVKSS